MTKPPFWLPKKIKKELQFCPNEPIQCMFFHQVCGSSGDSRNFSRQKKQGDSVLSLWQSWIWMLAAWWAFKPVAWHIGGIASGGGRV